VAGVASGGEWQLELERVTDPREGGASGSSSVGASVTSSGNQNLFNYAAALAASSVTAASRPEDFPSLPPSEGGPSRGGLSGSWAGKSLVKAPPKVVKGKQHGGAPQHASIRLVESFSNDLSIRASPSAPPPPPPHPSFATSPADYPPLPGGTSWSGAASSSFSAVRSDKDYPPLSAGGGSSRAEASHISSKAPSTSSAQDYPSLPSSSSGGKKGSRLVQRFEAGKVNDESASHFKDIRSSLLSRGSKGPALSAHSSWASGDVSGTSKSASMATKSSVAHPRAANEDDFPALATSKNTSGAPSSIGVAPVAASSQPSKQALKQAAKRQQREELRNLAFLR
jgi:hypothetical protein